MSLRGVANLLRRVSLSAFIVLAVPTLSWAQTGGCANGACFGTPSAGGGGGASCGSMCGACQMFHCPPAYVHCLERAPCIRWKCGCPRPVCNPCDLPHWGYFDTCWTPWPWPPDWTHCPTPPPAQFVQLNPLVHPNLQGQQGQPPRPPVGNAPRSGLPAPTFNGNGSYNGNGNETLPQPQRYEGPRSPF